MADGAKDLWVGSTYIKAADEDAEPGPWWRRLSRPLMVALIALGLGVSLGFGVLALRNLGEPGASDIAEATATPMPVEIASAQPAPPQPASAPLEVLAPETPRPSPAQPTSKAPAPPRLPAADPDFDCRRRTSQSELLVCGDAELTRLDRAMTRAFDQAVAAGVPYRSLRQDQDDWLRVREDAARHEPDGVAGMYRQRIAELREMAANFEGSPPAAN